VTVQDDGSPETWRERALLPALVFMGLVVAVVSSLGAPLIPTIAQVDHVSLSDAQWSLTITMLVGAVATPTMGRLGDGPRRREVILGALFAALCGSILAALPLGFGFLIVGRALQGIGLGLTSLAMATARDVMRAHRVRPAVALLSITTVAGVGMGYPITGLITQSFSYHAAFWFGAVVTGLALLTAWVLVPATSDLPARPIDTLGAGLLGVALALLLLGLSQAESWGWTSAPVLGLAAVAVVLLAGWTWHELHTELPLVDLRMVRHPAVLTADVTGLVAGVGMYLLMSAVVRFVQTPRSTGYGLGESVVVAGLVLVPFSIASVTANRVSSIIARRTSVYFVLPAGCAMFVASMVMFGLARGSLWQVVVVMTIAGLGVGCTFSAMPGLIVANVPANETGSALSFNQVLRYVGMAIGSALSATVLDAYTPSGQALPHDAGYGMVALIGCVVWAVAGVISFTLPRRGKTAAFDEVLSDESMADGLGEADGVVDYNKTVVVR
jgi:predicted MFS family arabinose efflux permease